MRVIKGKLVLSQREQNTIDKDAARFGINASDHCDGYEWPQKDDR